MSSDALRAVGEMHASVEGARRAAPVLETIDLGKGVVATGFGELVSQGVEGVNRQLLASQVDLQQLATGNAQNLHQIMIRLEETRLSFELLLQVRNRLLEAYQDVMKMQV
jgi:flagellar hook-basal body complex protein FliE